MLLDAEFICAYCGQVNATTVDPTAGPTQDYIEDCQVCCRPNRLFVTIDAGEAILEATAENP